MMLSLCGRKCAATVLSFALLATLSGCGGPKLVPVSGTVTIDGQPLTRGYIFVMPKDSRAAGSPIDGQGRFKLTTYEDNDGCSPGTHQVTVNSADHLSPTRVKHLIPPKYGQVETSQTTVTIDGPTDNLVVNLTWAGGKPYIESVEGEGDIGSLLPEDTAPTAKP